ncbi:hypothetical protein Taro_009486, partial [Colocasia esculenta]|nr:hypothetical protein [Colocasia esculenta]
TVGTCGGIFSNGAKGLGCFPLGFTWQCEGLLAETKKPAGTAEDIEKYFGCSASHLIMVGDRCFTDVVYGNQNGFLTILTGPLTLSNEPFIVQQLPNALKLIYANAYGFIAPVERKGIL